MTVFRHRWLFLFCRSGLACAVSIADGPARLVLPFLGTLNSIREATGTGIGSQAESLCGCVRNPGAGLKSTVPSFFCLWSTTGPASERFWHRQGRISALHCAFLPNNVFWDRDHVSNRKTHQGSHLPRQRGVWVGVNVLCHRLCCRGCTASREYLGCTDQGLTRSRQYRA